MAQDIEGVLSSFASIDANDAARIEALAQAALEEPRNFPQLYASALFCHKVGRIDLSVMLLNAACAVEPHNADAHARLGLMHAVSGDLDAALKCLQVAQSISPENPEILFSIGKVLETFRQFGDAAHFYRICVQLTPDDANAWYCYANASFLAEEKESEFQPQRMDEILTAAQQAVAIRPAPEHYRLIGKVYLRFCRERAVEAFAKAAEMAPGDANAYWNMGNAYRECGEVRSALHFYGKAEELGYRPALFSALMAKHYSDAFTNEDFLQASLRAAQCLSAPAPSGPFRCDSAAEKKLKVGYVSGDFCNHPVAFFLLSVLANHSENFDVHCFDAEPRTDQVAGQLRAQRVTWHEIKEMDDDQAAAYIRALGIDVLVDLSGHTAHNRLGVFARRAAPVQVSWLGFFGTTGLTEMDAVIADRFVVPEGEERYFVEQVIRMPDSYLCFSPPPLDAQVEPTAPMMRGKPPTFGSLNNRAKLSGRCIALWSEILRRASGARLFLKGPAYLDLQLCKQLERQFEAHGIDPARLVMEASSPRAAALRAYNIIDVGLDTMPFGGGTTTAETLWMGVPVVSRSGDRWVGRVSESILKTVGVPQLVADSDEEYVEMAVRLIGQPDELNYWRSTLRAKFVNSPLCDGVAFTAHLEAAYRKLWRDRCGKLATGADD